MVTSVFPMMMMTVFALSLVEFVQCNKCYVNGQNVGTCPGTAPCVIQPGGKGQCCAPGNKPTGVAGCCPSNSVPYSLAGCCPSGSNPDGTAVCCPSESEPHTFGGCCPKGSKVYLTEDGQVWCCSPGYRPWQLDDGKMMCCPNGQTCPRTHNAMTRELRDPVAASDGHSASVPFSPLVSRSKLASSYEKMMKNEK